MSTLTNAFRNLSLILDEVNWALVRATTRLTAVLVGLLLIVQSPIADPLDPDNQALAIIRDHVFDFTAWEASAVLDKSRASLVGTHSYLDEPQREQFVRDYLSLVNEIARLEGEVDQVYTDPGITDPDTVSADLRAERDALRQLQVERQAVAEAIIQSQTAAVLIDMGFGIGGQILPPVRIRFTQPPRLLVISPRDHIERTGNHPLQHDLTIDQQTALEDEVDEELVVSSLAVPLGGLAIYPAMLIETGSALNIFDITAHEWAHHHLSFFPLGFSFGTSPDLFTINETVASIIGEEVGQAVLERYYPDLAPPPPSPPLASSPSPDSDAPSPPEPEPAPNVFDFRAEMRATRVKVDELLAEGAIEAAESYMEEQRAVFVENGYNIRKLNQAYFAFYGSYADQPGASGEDPIGPLVREVRNLNPSLRDFVIAMRSVTAQQDLEHILETERDAAN